MMEMRNLEQYDISLEEFDSLAETHVFSKKYNDNKKKMLREYRKNIWTIKAENWM